MSKIVDTDLKISTPFYFSIWQDKRKCTHKESRIIADDNMIEGL